jgi:hypothetical protein
VAVKRNRELLDSRWDKNDKKDAANVADLVGQGRCLFYEIPEESLQKLRSLITFRLKLKNLQERSAQVSWLLITILFSKTNFIA